MCDSGSALAFGLMHMNFNQFCYAFVPALRWAFCWRRQEVFFATMTAHFVVNGWSTALMAVSKLLYGTSAGSSSTSSGALTTQGHDRCDQCLFRDRGDLYFCSDRSADLDCGNTVDVMSI